MNSNFIRNFFMEYHLVPAKTRFLPSEMAFYEHRRRFVDRLSKMVKWKMATVHIDIARRSPRESHLTSETPPR